MKKEDAPWDILKFSVEKMTAIFTGTSVLSCIAFPEKNVYYILSVKISQAVICSECVNTTTEPILYLQLLLLTEPENEIVNFAVN